MAEYWYAEGVTSLQGMLSLCKHHAGVTVINVMDGLDY